MKFTFILFTVTSLISIIGMASGYPSFSLLMFFIALIFLGLFGYKLESEYDKCFTKGNLNNGKVIKKAKDLQIL